LRTTRWYVARPAIRRKLANEVRVWRVDNRLEFISKHLDMWAYWEVVKLDFIRLGKGTVRLNSGAG